MNNDWPPQKKAKVDTVRLKRDLAKDLEDSKPYYESMNNEPEVIDADKSSRARSDSLRVERSDQSLIGKVKRTFSDSARADRGKNIENFLRKLANARPLP